MRALPHPILQERQECLEALHLEEEEEDVRALRHPILQEHQERLEALHPGAFLVVH